MRYPKRYGKRMFKPSRLDVVSDEEGGSLWLRKGQEGAAFAGGASLRANEGVSATGRWPKPSRWSGFVADPLIRRRRFTRLLLIRGSRRTASADVS
jgi:hypothetical protein